MVRVLNVVFGSPDWRARLLSNFAATPFELWGEQFGSVEGFWQGLKYPEGSPEQKRVFGLAGYEAKRAGRKAPVDPGGTFTWRGKTYAVGSPEHWELMRQALRAKFEQNPEARYALFATRGLKLVHELPRDSKTIPGAVFARMLEELRDEFFRREYGGLDSPSLPRAVMSRDGSAVGAVTGRIRRCLLEGCRGVRVEVLWPDGSVTWPCSAGMREVGPEVWQIL